MRFSKNISYGIRNTARRAHAVLAFVLAISIPGCAKNLGVPDAQLMQHRLPQFHRFDKSPEDVWGVVLSEPERGAGTVVVKDQASRLLTWVEDVETWNDLNTDAICGTMPLKQVRKLEKPPRSRRPVTNIAVTTIRVEPDGDGSVIRVRRVYYGSNTHVCLGHSRGDYERDLYNRIDSGGESVQQSR